MDSDVSEDYQDSDVELDDESHAKLVDNVISLSTKQFVKKPSRTEPTLNVSEYNLVGAGNKIQLHELTKTLKQKNKHVGIAKKVDITKQHAKTIPKPLEKPQADRIRRSVAYKSAKIELDKWDPIVTSLRASDHITYPLNNDHNLKKDEPVGQQFRIKSKLMQSLDELEPAVEVYNIEEENKFPLTMAEILEKRNEAAKMRAHQSYKEAKARRQNKIKSKKYHRVQKREKVKQQLVEFEQLQKNDPEAALQKLDEIEKARAEERISLRHKSTGQWAKNKLIRAKYDKESRQILAQQLAISRDLTQKVKATNNSDSENEDTQVIEATKSVDPNNPWLHNMPVSKEVNDFVDGYRKYWDAKNNVVEEENEKLIENAEDTEKVAVKLKQNKKFKLNEEENMIHNNKFELNDEIPANDKLKKKKIKNKNNSIKIEELSQNSKLNEEIPENGQLKKKKKSKNIKNNKVLNQNRKLNEEIPENDKPKRIKNKKKSMKELDESLNGIGLNCKSMKSVELSESLNETDLNCSSTTEWEVTQTDVEKEFRQFDDKLRKQLEAKYTKLANDLGIAKKKIKKAKKIKSKINPNLQAKPKKAIIDEALNESARGATDENKSEDFRKLKSVLEKEVKVVKDIDPNNFIKVKTTQLNSAIPDLLSYDDNEENNDQRDVITEAFQDDDIVNDFHKQKNEEIDKDKPKDIDLNLPGWGSWGGKNIKVSTRKRRRFITKFPKKMPRRDDNKGDLIINENADANIKKHRVSDLPFPFKTVKDYEASIRAPIGNTFVPELAYRKLILPAVLSKMGAIIEPMDDDILLKKRKTKVVEK